MVTVRLLFFDGITGFRPWINEFETEFAVEPWKNFIGCSY